MLRRPEEKRRRKKDGSWMMPGEKQRNDEQALVPEPPQLCDLGQATSPGPALVLLRREGG